MEAFESPLGVFPEGRKLPGMGTFERPLGVFPKGIKLPCLSLVDLHSLVQCLPFPHLLHTPEGRGILLGLLLTKVLFLGMSCL